MVKSSKQEKLEWGVILTALSLDFSLQEAEKQLNIAVDWGRYSEIFSYDDDMEIFFI
jgi:NitT/TauT family transport system ATP-binding protein